MASTCSSYVIFTIRAFQKKEECVNRDDHDPVGLLNDHGGHLLDGVVLALPCGLEREVEPAPDLSIAGRFAVAVRDGRPDLLLVGPALRQSLDLMLREDDRLHLIAPSHITAHERFIEAGAIATRAPCLTVAQAGLFVSGCRSTTSEATHAHTSAGQGSPVSNTSASFQSHRAT